jgi:hypothetical protein
MKKICKLENMQMGKYANVQNGKLHFNLKFPNTKSQLLITHYYFTLVQVSVLSVPAAFLPVIFISLLFTTVMVAGK